jgi:CYTH domain-containing protein
LRLLTNSDTKGQIIKLNKKFESNSPYFQTISRILLSPSEYRLFEQIEGDWLRKTRYYHTYLGNRFSIDVFKGELEGLILCEVEANNLHELMNIKFPEYAKHEVTEDTFFTGGNLCRITHSEIQKKLSAFS